MPELVKEPELATPLGTPPTNVASTTTPEEDRVTAGQRRINVIWELTQAIMAIGVTLTVCVVAAIRATSPQLIPVDNGPFVTIVWVVFVLLVFLMILGLLGYGPLRDSWKS